jgi:hypothetical protein
VRKGRGSGCFGVLYHRFVSRRGVVVLNVEEFIIALLV